MRVPLSWLTDYIELDGMDAEAIAEALTMAGLEVDGIDRVKAPFSGVIVARVTATTPHPEAERLCQATVTDGTDEYHLVCGAPNCREGLVTAFAKVGARLEGGEGKPFKIKKSKIRGVDSQGMLCSAVELGLGEDADGIIELGDKEKLGVDFGARMEETVFDVSLTPNLAHCMSVYGVARELAAVTGRPLSTSTIKVEETDDPVNEAAQVSVSDAEGCPRYACRVIKGLTVAPSPVWMQKHLENAGIRKINNIVDVTNYVLLEMGHPLHAFDYDKVDGHRIEVRSAQDGERFVTLDGEEQVLQDGDLLICDGKTPVAIGGVMGGQNSEVSDTTVNVLLESAYFDPRRVRRTARRLGLLTESSARFERGADPCNVIAALDRAAELLRILGGGDVCTGAIDVAGREFLPKIVTVRLSRVRSLLGFDLVQGEVKDVFDRLGFGSEWIDEDILSVRVPTYRADVSIEVDLIEEVARIYGYHNIPRSISAAPSSTMPNAPIFTFEREVRSQLVALGLQEFLTSDLVGPTMAETVTGGVITGDNLIAVQNPTSVEQSVLRPSLCPGLLESVRHNINHQTRDIAAFEIGRIYLAHKGERVEQSMVGVVITGRTSPCHWSGESEVADFYVLKGIVEDLLSTLGIESTDPLRFEPSALRLFHSGRQATVSVGEIELGVIGEMHPSLQRRLDLRQRVFYAELNLHDMIKIRSSKKQMRPIPAFPGSSRDWTLTLRQEVPVADVLTVIRKVKAGLLEDIEILDVYQSDKLGCNRKNVTLRFRYRDRKKTVAQEAVDRQHTKIKEQSMTTLGDRIIS
ncbi:Phenylalanine--tRNA ligase beta subunit [Chlamydiales bacterium SCGC AG-110-P3]|nr:Phenylalanine--tRNA ligase beta subunit [Chlamydiales bacterium SCGC AG-110-P3]